MQHPDARVLLETNFDRGADCVQRQHLETGWCLFNRGRYLRTGVAVSGNQAEDPLLEDALVVDCHLSSLLYGVLSVA